MGAVAREHCRIAAEKLDAEIVAQILEEVILEAAAHAATKTLESEMSEAFAEVFLDAPVTNLLDVKAGVIWVDLK